MCSILLPSGYVRVMQLVCSILLPNGYVGAAYVLKIRNSGNSGSLSESFEKLTCIYGCSDSHSKGDFKYGVDISSGSS